MLNIYQKLQQIQTQTGSICRTELKAKYGSDWKLSQEYKLWLGNKEVSHV